jgi:hypothetical protein
MSFPTNPNHDPPFPGFFDGFEPSQEIGVENLDLPELFRNPHVKNLFNNLQDANTQVIKSARLQEALFQENLRLSARVEELKIEHAQQV